MARRVIFLALLMTSCAKDWMTGVYSGDTREDYAVAEAYRYAQLLGVKLNGVYVTDKTFAVDCGDGTKDKCTAAGYYSGGKVYFWRAFLLRYTTTRPMISELAAHEVCHAKHYHHGTLHTACTQYLVNTYGP